MTQLGTKKSRKGCSHCKRRRVKCDEQRPICGNCQRRGEPCSLASPCSPSVTSDLGFETRDEDDWLQDLELMHNWTSRTSHTIETGDRATTIWSELVPQEAVRHSFLMHGLLSFSALHLSHLRPAEADKYLSLSDKHQAPALASYRGMLGNITAVTASALFALSSTICVSSLARSRMRASMMPEPKQINMDEVAEVFQLTRGVRNVSEVSKHFIIRGPFCLMYGGGHVKPEHVEITMPSPASERFAILYDMLRRDCSDVGQLDACMQALKDLHRVYESAVYYLAISKVEAGQIWLWSAFLSLEYVRLIQECFPPALAILAHFAALSSLIRDIWYVQNWGEYVLEGIRTVLGPDSEEFLAWPKEQILRNMSVLRCRQPKPEELYDRTFAVQNGH